MRRSRSQLIEALVAELDSVRRPGRTALTAAAWLLGSWTFVLAITLAAGPLRPGFASQLLESPRFLAESLLGVAVGVVLASSALRLGIPAPATPWQRNGLGLFLLAAWTGAYLCGLWDPALEPSMLGKREGCWLQTLLFGAPPLAAGLWLVRRLAPLHRIWNGALLGAAAGALPGLLMQIACMYVPGHILVAHVAPLFGLAALGALLGPLALRRP